MRTGAFLAIALAGLALSACASRYYYDDRYGYDDRYDGGYYGPPPGYYQNQYRHGDAYDRGDTPDPYYGRRDHY